MDLANGFEGLVEEINSKLSSNYSVEDSSAMGMEILKKERAFNEAVGFGSVLERLIKALAVEIVNRGLNIEALTEEYIEKYYREDRLIWSLFLGFGKIDRLLKTRVFGQRYELIMPGRIER